MVRLAAFGELSVLLLMPRIKPGTQHACPASLVGPHPLVSVLLFEKHTSGTGVLVHSFNYVALAALQLSV